MNKIQRMFSDFKYRVKSKLKSLLCSLSFHDWIYFNDGKSRVCGRCNRTEDYNTYLDTFAKVKQLDWEKRNEILY